MRCDRRDTPLAIKRGYGLVCDRIRLAANSCVSCLVMRQNRRDDAGDGVHGTRWDRQRRSLLLGRGAASGSGSNDMGGRGGGGISPLERLLV